MLLKIFQLLCLTTISCNAQAFETLIQSIEKIFFNDVSTFRKQYDFIIIGGGSAGCVVANRLSENPNHTVLLLEAGKEESWYNQIPVIALYMPATSYNWKYQGEPSGTACLGLVDGKCALGAGKALGGSSSIDFMVYARGFKSDYDGWSKLGNPGWSYDEVLPYFIEDENCASCSQIDDGFHGKSGPLDVEHPPYQSPLIPEFLSAGRDLGYNYTDPNGSDGVGFSRVLATMRRAARCSSSRAFLTPVRNRPNLHISLNTIVTKILIDPKTKVTTGVEFVKHRRKHTVKITKEVILSAGAYNSPRLLMLSGVGPKEDLARLSIPLIQDLRVGYNLMDHLSLNTLAFLINRQITISNLNLRNPLYILEYAFGRRGQFTLPGGVEGLAFIRTKLALSGGDPDVELVFTDGALNGDTFGILARAMGLPQSTIDRVYGPYRTRSAFSVAPIILQPKSRGRVFLRDSNPFSDPVIEPNFLADDGDVAILVEGVKMAISIGESSHFQKYNATLNKIPFPGCETIEFGTDPYWACVVRHFATTLGHQVGTCKMGPSNDSTAVVDPELQVYGIKGLRVIDGSIMPNIPAGHTNAPIIMIGEKGANMIKAKWA